MEGNNQFIDVNVTVLYNHRDIDKYLYSYVYIIYIHLFCAVIVHSMDAWLSAFTGAGASVSEALLSDQHLSDHATQMHKGPRI